MHAPTEAGPLVVSLPLRRSALNFFRVLGVGPVLLGVGALVQGKEIGIGLASLAIGVALQVGLHWMVAHAPRAYAAHAHGLVVTYSAGPKFIPWADVTGIRLAWRDTGAVRLAVYEIHCGMPKPLPLVPANEGVDATEQFLTHVSQAAGLRWMSKEAASRPQAA